MSLDISLKHLAEAAGVSRTTVSLALRNHPRISAAMRKRIQALAKEMGYVPNAEVSKVMGMIRENKENHDRPVIGLITDYEKPLRKTQPAPDTWTGFSRRATTLGYTPEEFWLSDGTISPKRLVGILHARGIRGIVFAALRDPAFVANMNLTGLACASIGHTLHRPALHRSSSDKYANTLLSCQKLWETGSRRIAAGAVDLVDAQLRRNESGIPPQPKLMVISGEWISARNPQSLR